MKMKCQVCEELVSQNKIAFINQQIVCQKCFFRYRKNNAKGIPDYLKIKCGLIERSLSII